MIDNWTPCFKISPGQPQNFERHNLWLTLFRVCTNRGEICWLEVLLLKAYYDPTSWSDPERRVTRPSSSCQRIISSLSTNCGFSKILCMPQSLIKEALAIGFLYPWGIAFSVPIVSQPSPLVHFESWYYIPKSGATAAYVHRAGIIHIEKWIYRFRLPETVSKLGKDLAATPEID